MSLVATGLPVPVPAYCDVYRFSSGTSGSGVVAVVAVCPSGGASAKLTRYCRRNWV